MPLYQATWVTSTGHDIGSLTDLAAEGRFTFAGREQVRKITGRFTGGTGTADMSFYAHKRNDGVWGVRHLYTEKNIGTGSDPFVVVPPNDPREASFLMDADTDFVVLWTNPDGANMKWVLDIETEAR